MLFRSCLAIALAGTLAAATGVAQQQPGAAVQLPTYSFFGASTTVVVPDRGSTYVGGVNRAATGLNEFGAPLLPFRPFKNRAVGTEQSASSMQVSAYIHDFEAMDEYLLSQPTRRFPNGVLPGASIAGDPIPTTTPASGVAGQALTLVERRAAALETQPADDPVAVSVPPGAGVAELRAKHLRQQQVRHEEAEQYFERGRKAEAEGKPNVAKIYYQMAARRAGDELKSRIAARLELIEGTMIAGQRR